MCHEGRLYSMIPVANRILADRPMNLLKSRFVPCEMTKDM
jgi:hypothetical protein